MFKGNEHSFPLIFFLRVNKAKVKTLLQCIVLVLDKNRICGEKSRRQVFFRGKSVPQAQSAAKDAFCQ